MNLYMTGRALVVSIVLAVVWTCAALWAVRPAPAPPAPALRFFIASTEIQRYEVRAHEVRVEGLCTVFVRDGVSVAGVCGQHTWTEATEAE